MARRRRRSRKTIPREQAREMLRRREYTSERQRRFLGARASGAPLRNPPPALKKAHAAIEGAYLSALKRKDKKALAVLAKPWEAIEGALRHGNPSARTKHLIAFTLKEGAKTVGHVVARTAVAAAKEAQAAGYQLGRRVRTEYCKNPPDRLLSTHADYIGYRHATDGRAYDHQWKKGVRVMVAGDKKSIKLYRPDGKPVADDF